MKKIVLILSLLILFSAANTQTAKIDSLRMLLDGEKTKLIIYVDSLKNLIDNGIYVISTGYYSLYDTLNFEKNFYSIKYGDTIRFMSLKKGNYLVRIKDKIGIVKWLPELNKNEKYKLYDSLYSEIRYIKFKISELEKELNKQTEAYNRRKSFIQSHPNISKRFKNLIIKGSITLGMTKDMVLASWGKPKNIQKTVSSFGVMETWFYGSGFSGTVLNFYNGKLESWTQM